MKVAYARREAIAAGLFGMAIAGMVWGPVIFRSLHTSRTVDLGTLHLPEGQPLAQPHPSTSRARVAKPKPSGRVDINHADVAALQTLPGIGPTLAQRIVAHRQAYGRFTDTHSLMEVEGIGPKRFDKVAPWIKAR